MVKEVGDAEEEALKRKERLKKFKRNVEDDGSRANDSKSGEETSSAVLPTPVFRNYQPQDDSLKENALPKAKPESAEEAVKDHLEIGASDHLTEEVDLVSLAPRKVDWDLKRDVSKKLEKLEKKTQKAIVELIRERLLKSNDVDLADAVNTCSEKANPRDAESDED